MLVQLDVALLGDRDRTSEVALDGRQARGVLQLAGRVLHAQADHVATVRRDLFGLRMQHATGELENTARLTTVKRDLARAITVAKQRGVELHEHTTS